MANVRTSIDIAVPPERVWELVTDLERLGEWVSIHRDFPEPPPSEVRTGTRFQQTIAVAGTPFAVECKRTTRYGLRRTWIEQARRQAKQEAKPWLLVIAEHRDRSPIVVLEFRELVRLIEEAAA